MATYSDLWRADGGSMVAGNHSILVLSFIHSDIHLVHFNTCTHNVRNVSYIFIAELIVSRNDGIVVHFSTR